jgi:hypothetical protein
LPTVRWKKKIKATPLARNVLRPTKLSEKIEGRVIANEGKHSFPEKRVLRRFRLLAMTDLVYFADSL